MLSAAASAGAGGVTAPVAETQQSPPNAPHCPLKTGSPARPGLRTVWYTPERMPYTPSPEPPGLAPAPPRSASTLEPPRCGQLGPESGVVLSAGRGQNPQLSSASAPLPSGHGAPFCSPAVQTGCRGSRLSSGLENSHLGTRSQQRQQSPELAPPWRPGSACQTVRSCCQHQDPPWSCAPAVL